MKIKKTSIFLSIAAILLWGCQKDPREIVLKSAVELSNTNSIAYNNTVLMKKDADASEKSHTAHCYFNFTSDTPIMKSAYHIKSDSTEIIYDNEKNILINHQLKFIVIDESPDKFSLLNTTHITYSLHSLRNLLGRLIDDENVELTTLNDTTINDIKCYQVRIQLNNYWVDQLDGFPREVQGQYPVYYLMVNKKTFLPVQFTLMRQKNQSYHSSTFTDIKRNTREIREIEYRIPTDFEDYPEYSLSDYRERLNNMAKITTYEEGPDFELESVEGNIISLADINKPVFLFFFDPDNETCRDIFGKISENKTADENIQYLAIEITGKSKESVKNFIESNAIDIPVLINGSEIAKQYGVIYAPALFRIDREGKLKFYGRNLNMEKGKKPESADLKTS